MKKVQESRRRDNYLTSEMELRSNQYIQVENHVQRPISISEHSYQGFKIMSGNGWKAGCVTFFSICVLCLQSSLDFYCCCILSGLGLWIDLTTVMLETFSQISSPSQKHLCHGNPVVSSSLCFSRLTDGFRNPDEEKEELAWRQNNLWFRGEMMTNLK